MDCDCGFGPGHGSTGATLKHLFAQPQDGELVSQDGGLQLGLLQCTFWRSEQTKDAAREQIEQGRSHGATLLQIGRRAGLTKRSGLWTPRALELAGEELTHAGPMGDEATLAEFAPTDDEELALGVDVADTQAARLPCSQPEAVAEGEDGLVGRSAIGGPRAVGEGGSGLEQLRGLGGVVEERYAPIRLSSAGPDRR
jgi:hypothetical protein